MPDIPNPKTGNAAIVFFDKNLNRIIPDQFDVYLSEGTSVEWVIIPPNAVTVDFKGDSPFEWDFMKSTKDHKKITGTVQDGKVRKKPYKYVVTDRQGNTIDPRIRVKR